jgi:hypothetical protein
VPTERSLRALAGATFLLSFALIVLEQLSTRLFGIVLTLTAVVSAGRIVRSGA